MIGALDWVVGVDWPEGDEAAMRELADGWRAAGRALAPLIEDGDIAALAAVEAFGGPDGLAAGALLAQWRALGRGDEATMSMIVGIADVLGTALDDGANDLEGVKLEYYIELGVLLIELLALAAAAVVTLGGSTAAAAPAMMATRFAIMQILKRATANLLRKASRKGIKDLLEDRAKHAVEQRVKSRLGLFAFHAGREGLEEGLQESATSLASQAYQISDGNRRGLDGADIAQSGALGALGGAAGGVTHLGGLKATSKMGMFGEHAVRGAGGEILAEGTIAAVTGQGLSWTDIGMAGTSATTGSLTGDLHHELNHRLAGIDAKLGDRIDVWQQPDFIPLPEALATAAEDTTAPVAVTGPVAGRLTTAHHVTVAGDAVAATVTQPAGGGVHAGVSTDPAAVRSGVTTATGEHGGALAGATAYADVTHAQQTTIGGTATAAPGVTAAQAAPAPAPLVGPVPHIGPAPSAGQATLSPGHAATSPQAPAQPGRGEPDLPEPAGSGHAHPGAPSPRGPEPDGGGFLSLSRITPAVMPPAGGGGPAVPPAGPRIAEDPAERGAYEYIVGDDRITGLVEALRIRVDRLVANLRRREAAVDLQIDDLLKVRGALPYQERAVTAELDGRRIGLDDRRRTLGGRIERLMTRWTTAFTDRPVALLDQALLDHLNDDSLGGGIRLAAGGVIDGDVSRLTGSDWPPPVEATRRYGMRGGYRRPLALHQQDLELAVPRDDRGRPLRRPDIFGPWRQLVNDTGPLADRTRSLNCVDVTLSFFDLWLHGRPRVAAPRMLDTFVIAGDSAHPVGGEPDGVRRVEEATGGRFQELLALQADVDPADQDIAARQMFGALARALRDSGDGAVAALIVQGHDPAGPAHMMQVVNQGGEIYYLDLQRPDNRPGVYPPTWAYRADALLVGADGAPGRVFELPPGGWGDGTPLPDPTGMPPARRAGPGDPAAMLRDASPQDLRELGVGEATLADLGFGGGEALSERDRAAYEAMLPRTAVIHPSDIAFTRRSVPPKTDAQPGAIDGGPGGLRAGRKTTVELENDLELYGWHGAPLHAVRWGDGSLAGLDDQLLRAARRAGLPGVPVLVHQPSEPLPAESARPGGDGPLAVDIRRLPDGSWAAGGTVGDVVYRAGAVPATWGELALFRSAGELSLLPGQTFGSRSAPVLMPEAADLSRRVLTRAETAGLDAVRQAALESADRVERDLAEIVPAAGAGLPAGERLRLRDTAAAVVSAGALAERFLDESDAAGHDVEWFARHRADDVLSFDVVMPGPDGYAGALDAVIEAMGGRGHTLVSVDNHWQAGNSGYGLHAVFRTPGGQAFTVRFPTQASLDAAHLQQDLAPVVGEDRERPARRVHALLGMLAVNRAQGLGGLVPPGLADRYPPRDNGLAGWIGGQREAWADYQEWLRINGRGLDDIVAEFGLTRADIPPGLRPQQSRQEGKDAGIPPFLSGRQPHRGSGERLRGEQGGGVPLAELEPPSGRLGVRPGDGEPDAGRRGVPAAPPAGGPADRAAGGPGLRERRGPARRGHHPMDLPDEWAGHDLEPDIPLDGPSWSEVEHLLPDDGEGSRFTVRGARYLGITPESVRDRHEQQVPMGMSGTQMGRLQVTLRETLLAEGLSLAEVDARLKGSSTEGYSGPHKRFPSPQEIAEHPVASLVEEEWFGDDPERPVRRPFDSMYRLGMEPDPSDYDLQLSGDVFAERAARVDRVLFPDRDPDTLLNPKYGFIRRDAAAFAFPHLYRWARVQSEALSREVAPAFFPSAGPPDNSAAGVSSHFRTGDWIIDLDLLDAAGVAELFGPALTEEEARDIAVLLATPEVRRMLAELEQGSGGPAAPGGIGAQEMRLLLRRDPDLAFALLATRALRSSLTQRPVTLGSLAASPEAVQALLRVSLDVAERGAMAVRADGMPAVPPTPLRDWHRAVAASITAPDVSQARQPGFDTELAGDPGYRDRYLDRLLAAAVPAQRELNALATELAGDHGAAGWREEPKDRQRAVDKCAGKGRTPADLTDLAGARVQFHDLDELYRCLDRIRQDPRLRIVGFTDRFALPQGSGYRDIQLVVALSGGHLGELRLHLHAIDAVARWEHKLFEVRRDLETLAGEPEPDRPAGRTVTEQALIMRILSEQQRVLTSGLLQALAEAGR